MPPETDERFVDHLCRLGQTRPGSVLLPTSDQTAWLYAREAGRLGTCFRSYQPAPEVLASVLDKARLAETARRAGATTLDTWIPGSLGDVRTLAPDLIYPILIKPRSHVDRMNSRKGELANDADELVRCYERMVRREHEAQSHADHEDVDLPILQHFVPMGPEGVHSVTGFIDRSGELFVTRISAKVFLRMYPAGVGVCYESRPANAGLSDAAYRLCRTAGFHGVFEIEFIRSGANWSVIDFNPRLFSQVGLDIARGMPLPKLLWLAALDRHDELDHAVRAAAAAQDDSTTALYDRFTLGAMLTAMALTARAPKAERAYWHAWRRRHADHAVDFMWDRHDVWPGIAHTCSELALGLKALPRFVRGHIQATRDAKPLAETP